MDGPKSPLRGIFWMFVTGLSFVAVTAIVKIMGDRIPPAEAAFLRYVLGLVFLIPMIRPLRETTLTPRLWTLFAVRGVSHSVAVSLWFFAMTQIAIADVTALNYLAPVYVSIGAALFLGERLKARRIAAVVAALLGAVIILRPGFREIAPGHMAMLAAGIIFAVSYLIAKIVADEVPAVVVVAMLSIFVTLGLTPLALMDWVWPNWWEVGLLFAVACIATSGHYTMTLAFASAPLTVTQPVTFLQLVWAVLLGAVLFAEPVDVFVIAGGGVIMAAVSFITWREAVLQRRPVTPASPAPKL
jgi:drug/metabolite transporter (DMT)-like permease